MASETVSAEAPGTADMSQVEFLRMVHTAMRQFSTDLEKMLRLRVNEVAMVRTDTALAFGGALGALDRACALAGRDVDDAMNAWTAPKPAELAASALPSRLQRGTRLLLVFKGFQLINANVWEGQVLEVSPDGAWLKLLDGMQRTRWLRYDGLDIVQVLGMADLARVDVAPEDSDHE